MNRCGRAGGFLCALRHNRMTGRPNGLAWFALANRLDRFTSMYMQPLHVGGVTGFVCSLETETAQPNSGVKQHVACTHQPPSHHRAPGSPGPCSSTQQLAVQQLVHAAQLCRWGAWVHVMLPAARLHAQRFLGAEPFHTMLSPQSSTFHTTTCTAAELDPVPTLWLP